MNRQRRHIATVLLMTGMALHLAAQSYVTPVTANLVPPTPQSWTPIERQMPQPSLLTGTLSLSIPVYTVTVGDYSLPVSLSYSGAGVKVMDDPCPLGYGWTLLPALRATRTVMGRPDEHYQFMHRPADQSVQDDYGYKCLVDPNREPTVYDSEHDIFTFALPDGNITRVLHYDSSNPVFVGDRESDYRISADRNLDRIQVTDSRGVIYVFGGAYEMQVTQGQPSLIRSTWALTEIILDSREQIRFTWSNIGHPHANMNVLGGYSFMDTRPTIGENFHEDSDNDDAATAAFKNFGASPSYLTLMRVDFPGGKMDFSYQSKYGDGPFLTDIRVMNEKNSCVRSASLSYHASIPLLKEVALSNEGSYTMAYNETDWSIYGARHAQDWWGYYNGKVDNPGLTPHLFIKRYYNDYFDFAENYDDQPVYEIRTFEVPGADRNVDVEKMQANILTRITYPTGGFSEFEYEPHRFAPVRDESAGDNLTEACNPKLSEGGGLRVKKIKFAAGGDDANPRTVQYSYSEATVRSVPSAATFIDIRVAATPYMRLFQGTYIIGLPIPMYRIVNISPVSSYQRYDIGTTPIWYNTVTVQYDEGYETYHFSDILRNNNGINTSYGKRTHGDLFRVFSRGPQLVGKEVYKKMPGHHRCVESETWVYTEERKENVSAGNFVDRKIIQVNPNSLYCPDLDYGYGVKGPLENKILKLLPGETIYDIIGYGIYTRYEQLTSHSRTVYGEDGGGVTTEETFTYVPDSERVSTVTSKDSRSVVKTVTVDYPQAGRSWVEGQMVSRGMTGVPIKETVNEGGAVTVYEMEYGRTGGWTLIPVQMRTRFGASADALEGPRFSHNSWGRPTGWTDADGISELWLWGHFGRYPVWNVPGETYLSVYNNKKIRVDTQRADTIPASKVREKFPHATEYRFKPLVGLSAVVTPAGTGSYYSYDAAGRLDSVRLNDRLLTSYKYNVSQTGDNYVRASHEISTPRVEGELSSFSHDIKTTYDGLGRPVETRDYSTGIRSLREYDAMGRLWRESVASRNAPGEYDWTLYGYETSPRGVLTSTTKPGEAWYKGGKAATVRVLTNKTSGEYSLATYSFTGGGIARTGTYPAASLLIEESTDEDGHVVRKFTDKNGRTVATSEGVSGQMLTTRYIYGDYGRLRYVLPPDIPDGTVSAATLAEKAYFYSYDSRGRLTESRVPGCAPARTRYSRAGRVVAEHPSAMAEGKWLLHFYDKFGREILTTIASPTEAQLQSLCDTLRTASYFGYNLHGGYKFDRALPCDFGEIQKAIYYDDYKFATRTDADYGFDTPPAVTAGEAPGLVTGECDYSEGPSAGRGTLYSYDGRGFVVEKWAMLPVGRQHTVYTYDDFGRVITETETLCRGTTPLIERETVNGYDSAGRLIRLSVTENGVTARMSYGYNELGLLSKTVRGLDIQHLQEYDVHGWPTRSTISIPKALPVVPGTIQPLSLSDTYYSGLIVNPGGDVVAPEFQLPRKEYVEELSYAEGGAIPRFTGCPSARVTTLGGRYDYHFDVHDRLTRADYTPRDADSGEDFSARYIYDDLARPRRVVRWGVVNRTEDNAEEFGVLDDLIYTYDGSRLQSIAYDSEGMEYYGRPGYPGVTQGEYTWNDAGLMTSDSANGISLIDYNHFGLPIKTVAGRGATTCRYTVDGALATRTSRISGSKASTTTTYSAGRMVTTDALGNIESLYSYFPGGYFDKDGKIHYTFTDYQGSVIMVTDSVGEVEEHHGYYPYGEPWRTPEGQPLLYQGKERLASTGDHDFGARTLATPTLLWRQPDPMAHGMPQVSPYVFCFANPIMFVDHNGLVPTAYEASLMARAAYMDDNYDDIIKELESLDWIIFSGNTNIKMNESESGAGLQSILFQRKKENGELEYAYAYAGTDSTEDAVDDALQLVGLSPQYALAISNARKLRDELGDSELTFVGHSLGGGEAAASSMATGDKAMTFNPAAVSFMTRVTNGLWGEGDIDNYISSTPAVMGISVAIDPLTIVQNRAGMRAPGRTIHVPVGYLPTHKIEDLVNHLMK